MPVKIRLARHGRKRNAYYYIVVADGRAPRDGKYIERIGDYNPNTNPATINLNFEKALSWLEKGAQPTDTARAILSYEGVMYKKHLLGGIKKGAFDEATAESKFNTWKQEKLAKIQAKHDKLAKSFEDEKKKRLEEEAKVNELRAQNIAKKNSELVAQLEAEQKAEEEINEEVSNEQKSEDTEETPDKKEEIKAEADTTTEEVKTEEAPKEETKDEKAE